MIYDGTQVAEVKTARVKLQPDQPASTVQKNTAAKVQAQPIVSNAAKSQALLKDKELPKTASADPDKSKKLNFVVPQENFFISLNAPLATVKTETVPSAPLLPANPTNTI